MSYEVESRGKKMHMNKNIARLAATAGLTAALSFGGVMAPVTMAFAEDTAATANTITINKNENNGDVKYKAYQIFKADVVDSTGEGATDKIVSNVKWAIDNTATQDAIINAIKEDSTYKTSNPKPSIVTAQDVADWLTKNVTGTTPETVVNKDHLLNKIAAIVKKDVQATGNSFSAGDSFTVPKDDKNSPKTGYYLFLTDESSLSTSEVANKNTGTSPIFAVVGGSSVTVTEKTSIPTVEKKIKNDDGSEWADKADSQMGQKVKYKLTGTVASNIATFDTYQYEFSDKLSDGLTADYSSVIVKIGNKTLSRNATPGVDTGYDVSIDKATNTLTVKFTDLKAAAEQADATLNGSSNVVVTYTAQLDSTKAEKVVVGGMGNENTVKLTYSNNPMGEGKGESVSDTVRDYTYALKLVKEDSADENTKLDGVKFTIQATDPDDAGSKDMYVNDEGILVADPVELETKNGGIIEVKGLDAGTYTVKETHTLGGYNTLPDFTFKISTVKADGTDSLKQPEGDNTLSVSVIKSNVDLVKEPSVKNGTVTLTIQNKKGSGLPLTGLNGVTFTWIAGGAVLCIGVAHLIRSRKQAEESEQE